MTLRYNLVNAITVRSSSYLSKKCNWKQLSNMNQYFNNHKIRLFIAIKSKLLTVDMILKEVRQYFTLCLPVTILQVPIHLCTPYCDTVGYPQAW